MEYKELKDLSQRFWEGETTEREEDVLKAYFLNTEDINPEFKELASYFKCMQMTCERKELDDSFDDEIMAAIEAQPMGIAATNQPIRRSMMPFLRIAASVVIFAFVGMTGYTYYTSGAEVAAEEIADTYEDPERAFAEMKKALMMVSSNLNNGLEYTSEIKKFDEAKQALAR